MKRVLLLLAVLHLSGCATAHLPAEDRGPLVAHHQHLISPTFAPIVQHDQIDAAALLKMMDDAGSKRAVILSMGDSFADERKGSQQSRDAGSPGKRLDRGSGSHGSAPAPRLLWHLSAVWVPWKRSSGAIACRA